VKDAIKSFLILTCLVLILAFFGWSYARYRALSTPLKPPLDHAFLRDLGALSVIAYPRNQEVGDWTFLEKASGLSSSVILWIDVRFRSEDRTLVVAREKNAIANAPKLTEVFERFPHHRLILNVQGHQPDLIPSFIAVIEDAQASDRLLIQSPEKGFLTEMRQERPLWLYGTSLAQVTQLIMLSSLGLQPLAPLRGDVLVVENEEAFWRLNDRAISEALRRGMKVFAGPLKKKEQALELHQRGVTGILISDPELMLELLRSADAS